MLQTACSLLGRWDACVCVYIEITKLHPRYLSNGLLELCSSPLLLMVDCMKERITRNCPQNHGK